MKGPSHIKKDKSAKADFEIYVADGDVHARCKSCGDIPRLEYVGFDPVYPQFKVICDRCGTTASMKLQMVCHGMAWVPYHYPWDTEAAKLRAAEHARLHRVAKGQHS